MDGVGTAPDGGGKSEWVRNGSTRDKVGDNFQWPWGSGKMAVWCFNGISTLMVCLIPNNIYIYYIPTYIHIFANTLSVTILKRFTNRDECHKIKHIQYLKKKKNK